MTRNDANANAKINEQAHRGKTDNEDVLLIVIVDVVNCHMIQISVGLGSRIINNNP